MFDCKYCVCAVYAVYMVCQLYHTTYLLFLIIFPPVKYWPQFDWLPLSDVYSAIIISPTSSVVSQQQQFRENTPVRSVRCHSAQD